MLDNTEHLIGATQTRPPPSPNPMDAPPALSLSLLRRSPDLPNHRNSSSTITRFASQRRPTPPATTFSWPIPTIPRLRESCPSRPCRSFGSRSASRRRPPRRRPSQPGRENRSPRKRQPEALPSLPVSQRGPVLQQPRMGNLRNRKMPRRSLSGHLTVWQRTSGRIRTDARKVR